MMNRSFLVAALFMFTLLSLMAGELSAGDRQEDNTYEIAEGIVAVPDGVSKPFSAFRILKTGSEGPVFLAGISQCRKICQIKVRRCLKQMPRGELRPAARRACLKAHRNCRLRCNSPN